MRLITRNIFGRNRMLNKIMIIDKGNLVDFRVAFVISGGIL
ncbi:hypothetical protein MuYL_0793 [Mucilaginibacter xinganensis]|uniref:Uncharacterized protein n=1 Tax=Mucilaginibacter xinganensis TaxID=1234841 RepID=A0A223NS60_9SPHI|nr:hypothetical protein MuYL_0793 [Mucilaginibacter xinganensis]